MFNESTWKIGEELARKYMKKQGYKIVYTNFSGKGFELDIVATLSARAQIKKLKIEYKEKLKNTKSKEQIKQLKLWFASSKKMLSKLLVITEVKARADDRFGSGCECINIHKKKYLERGAKTLLQMNKFKGLQVRFDVASVDYGKVIYIENAL